MTTTAPADAPPRARHRARSPWEGKFEKIVIILSTGRTGTMALAHYFDTSYEQVTALHEPKPTRNLRLWSNRAVAGKASTEACVAALRKYRRQLLRQMNTPVYIESNWYLYGLLEPVRRVFDPGVKILHVVRDPRTYIRSHLNFGTFAGLRWAATEFIPYWYLRPEQCEPSPAKTWRQMNPQERLAWQWHVVHREVEKAGSMFGDDYRRVRFEDLFPKEGTAGNDVLPGIVDWIGLPPNDKLLEQARHRPVNASKDRGVPKFGQWDEQTRRAVIERCGAQMERYGYSTADEAGRA